MKITKNGVVLTANEKEAVMKAHNIIVERFAAAGEVYDYKISESVEYCLYGALYTGGIDGMMRYATETPITRKREVGA